MGYITIDPLADIGHPVEYYIDREITLDCRGELHISPLSNWGIGVKIITATHDTSAFGAVVYRPVVVAAGAWICSYAILYNCSIGENAIVAIGAVVRSMNVPANTMVEGNPARIIEMKVGDVWKKVRR